MKRKQIFRLQTTITLLVCLVLAFVLLIIYFMFSQQFKNQTRRNLEERVVAVSRTMALTPSVQEALGNPQSSFNIQQYANKIRRLNDVEFVVVIDMEGIRRSHPVPELVGQHVAGGDEQPVLSRGEHKISIAEGTLGTSLRAYVPVFNAEGSQVGAVLTGVLLRRVSAEASRNQWILYWGLGLGGGIGAIGAYLLARKIKQTIYDMEPFEIAKLLKERNAMLQSAKEGIIAVDEHLQVTLLNEEGRRLFRQAGLPAKLVDEDIRSIWPGLGCDKILRTGESVSDEEVELGAVIVRVSSVPILVNGEVAGVIATFRDKTEIRMMNERLSGLSSYAEALRAQAHEFRNKLHVIYGMAHMAYYDQLQAYISETLQTHESEVGAVTEQIRDQVMAGFILGKMSRAREAGIDFVLLKHSSLPEPSRSEVMHHLITILGNLFDNAMESLKAEHLGLEDPLIELSVCYEERTGELNCIIRDNGSGISEEIQTAIYDKGFSTKGDDRGMGLYLVMLRVKELGGRIDCLSRRGEGTQFTVSVPYAVKDAVI
ncbi:DcuS/MalK family sensor histidine kinase [Paenibacillus lentus]|uniref:histidine kinase n=1 Tax=Paenibacillus lentus TaxID=1338368 RepID=A0A3Q8SBH9_9BACL|nr:DcuS/MalK family sensor histidine kinase [Paenibacillus lentus]AZK46817.1 two-component system sensor histidine kinase DcuS [Paenibacillus lentus]